MTCSRISWQSDGSCSRHWQTELRALRVARERAESTPTIIHLLMAVSGPLWSSACKRRRWTVSPRREAVPRYFILLAPWIVSTAPPESGTALTKTKKDAACRPGFPAPRSRVMDRCFFSPDSTTGPVKRLVSALRRGGLDCAPHPGERVHALQHMDSSVQFLFSIT